MNNKTLGNNFEMEFVDRLGECGFWSHFLNPNRSGSQPFDVIAIRDGQVYVFDCKTSVKRMFNISRLEDNQIYSFNKVLKCGCNNVYIAVKYEDNIYLIDFITLLKERSVKLNENLLFGNFIN